MPIPIFKNAIERLEHLRALLDQEKQAELDYFREKVKRQALADRVEQGFSWYPIEVLRSGYTYGDRAFVTLQRTTNLGEPHQFRSGKTVSLFTRSPEVKRNEMNGVINYVQKDKMKIILSSKDLPDWLGSGMIGIDLLFDERTYQKMDAALKQVIKAKGDRLAELRDIFEGKRQADFIPFKEPLYLPMLNEFQTEGVRHVLAAQQVALLHGPPGTGKTTTLVEAVKLLCERERQVLVCAPSNTAVDLLTERLTTAGLNVVRIGNIGRVDEGIIQHTLDYQLAAHPEAKNIKKIKIEAAAARKEANRYRRKFSNVERRQRRDLRREAKELAQWAIQLEDRIMDQILSGADVVCSTLVGSTLSELDRFKFRTVVIDEAAQGLEPATWIPLLKASKVVLAGDPFQLPPTVKSMEAEKGGLGVTLLERALEHIPEARLLRMQYRMNEIIMGFSNLHFYDGRLLASAAVQNHRLEIKDDHPLVYIDTAGSGFEEKLHAENLSRYNPGEWHILREHLYLMLPQLLDLEEFPSIGIISPYREQVILMNTEVAEDERLSQIPMTIQTIDGFQGQERDIIYISLVRSNAKTEIGFLKDYRRINVALTRARKKLVVVGDSATLGGDDFYQKWLTFVEREGLYESAWGYMK